MRVIFLTLILLSCLKSFASSNNHHNLILDLDGKEYQQLLEKSQHNRLLMLSNLDFILKFGQRNLEWLDYMNQFRETKLTFSTPGNRRSYTVESPKIYNEAIILAEYNSLLEQLPTQMKEVLIDGKPFTQNPPISEDDYLRFGHLADYVYQGAARWILLSPWIQDLKERRILDIRGFYWLAKTENLTEKLTQYSSLSANEQTQLSSWLMGICYNKEANDKICQENFQRSLKQNNGQVLNFYSLYIDQARAVYNANFIIPENGKRKDITWKNQNPSVATIPFLDSNLSPQVKDFLHNIELEWKWENWQLLLNYVQFGNVPYIEFAAGETPHVNGLGGNQIVMDANQPLTEWDSQWTIRHEFGHVLGFPDCYVEFYDDSLKAIVNYQIDETNLMCSRKGSLQKIHFLEMQRNYFK